MSKVTQAIVLSVFELTMPPSDDSDIFECSKATTTTTADKFKNTKRNVTVSEEKPKRFPFIDLSVIGWANNDISAMF